MGLCGNFAEWSASSFLRLVRSRESTSSPVKVDLEIQKKILSFPLAILHLFGYIQGHSNEWASRKWLSIRSMFASFYWRVLKKNRTHRGLNGPLVHWSTGPLVHWSTAPIMPLVHGARCYGVCVFLFTCILINLIFYFDQFNFLFCFQFSPFLLLFYFLLVNSFFFFLVQADTALICYLWAG